MGRKKLSAGKVFRNVFYILAIIWGILTPLFLLFSMFFTEVVGNAIYNAGGEIPAIMYLMARIYEWPILLAQLMFGETYSAYLALTYIMFFILFLVPVAGVFAGIRCWKERRFDSVVASNAGMVVGAVVLNPLLVIAGFINHRVYLKNNKYMPSKKGRLR